MVYIALGCGARKKGTDVAALGDCVDCGLCVVVCPTGIDIRKGLQYECISCSACIDVCDGVMEKMHYPPGLIRNSTQNGVDQKLTRRAMFMRAVPSYPRPTSQTKWRRPPTMWCISAKV